MQPIKNNYGGKVLRSKLERKWAMFFDKCKIEYEYEPFTLKGWLPDFLIKTKTGKPILVEVKPFPPERFEALGEDMKSLEDAGYGKAIAYCDSYPILILGDGLYRINGSHCGVGLLIGRFWGDGRISTDYAALKYDTQTGDFGISPDIGIWDDLVNPKVDRKGFIYEENEIYKVADSFYHAY